MEEMKDRIAAARKLAGLTQEQLGELLGVTRQAVSKWESGQTVPDAVTVARLCEALHVSADYVLLGKEPEESDDQTPPSTHCRTPVPAAAGLWRGPSVPPAAILCPRYRPVARGTQWWPPVSTMPMCMPNKC